MSGLDLTTVHDVHRDTAVENARFSYQLCGLSVTLRCIITDGVEYAHIRAALQCYFNTYLSQETTYGFMLFLVQPKDFACTTGLMGSYTLLLPPRSYALLHVRMCILAALSILNIILC